MMNTKYKMNGLAKDFGIKSKDFAVYAEKAGLKGKSNMAALTSDEFDALLSVLTAENQITDMADYLQGQSYIKVLEEKKEEKPAKEAEKKVEEKPAVKEEQKQPEAKALPAEETETKKQEKPAAPVQTKSKEDLAAEKQARFKDARQKQMDLQAQKQAKQAQKQRQGRICARAAFDGSFAPAPHKPQRRKRHNQQQSRLPHRLHRAVVAVKRHPQKQLRRQLHAAREPERRCAPVPRLTLRLGAAVHAGARLKQPHWPRLLSKRRMRPWARFMLRGSLSQALSRWRNMGARRTRAGLCARRGERGARYG
jgi:hypothetical protein